METTLCAGELSRSSLVVEFFHIKRSRGSFFWLGNPAAAPPQNSRLHSHHSTSTPPPSPASAPTGVKRGDAPRLGEVDSASNLEGAVEALKEQQQRPLRAQGPASAWPPQKGAAGGAPGKGAKGFGKNE
jgi:hypothetical protein